MRGWWKRGIAPGTAADGRTMVEIDSWIPADIAAKCVPLMDKDQRGREFAREQVVSWLWACAALEGKPWTELVLELAEVVKIADERGMLDDIVWDTDALRVEALRLNDQARAFLEDEKG